MPSEHQEEEEEPLYGAAYEEMTYQDSTDDDVDAEVLDVMPQKDFDLTYERLTAAARAAAAGAPIVTPNVDPRLPLEDGDFLPGCGAIVAAVCVAAGVQPIVVGKPQPPLFRMALARLGLRPHETAMVGDSVTSDVAGGRAVGMPTVLYAPEGAPPDAADVVVRSFAELARLAGVAP